MIYIVCTPRAQLGASLFIVSLIFRCRWSPDRARLQRTVDKVMPSAQSRRKVFSLFCFRLRRVVITLYFINVRRRRRRRRGSKTTVYTTTVQKTKTYTRIHYTSYMYNDLALEARSVCRLIYHSSVAA